MQRSVASFYLAALGLASISSASAQQPIVMVKSGEPKSIRVFFNCGPRGTVPSVSGAASHGTITARQITQNRCGNPDQQVL